ncbi:MAG: hypothetical protein EAY75_16500 [Bacteroidetes bacterium]|nr:MAG: hypothetical protein EAY75_16500 [Bacteroidota bacterium]
MKPAQFLLFSCVLAGMLCCGACSKQVLTVGEAGVTQKGSILRPKPPGTMPTRLYRKYFIAKGQNSAVPSPFEQSNLTELRYRVIFDSSCVYSTVDPKNQIDINKLFGFADNNSFHQVNSARIGWRWLNDGLELLGYVYNNGTRSFQYITTVSLFEHHDCFIRVVGGEYIFTVDNSVSITMPRASKNATAQGYLLFPYFGGDETAPKNITILMQRL